MGATLANRSKWGAASRLHPAGGSGAGRIRADGAVRFRQLRRPGVRESGHRDLEAAVQLDDGRNPSIDDRLAAVYAMSGRFSDAAITAAGAAVADAGGDGSLSKSLREDARSYEARTGAR